MKGVEKEVFEKLGKRLRDYGFEIKQLSGSMVVLVGNIVYWKYQSFHDLIFSVKDNMSLFETMDYVITNPNDEFSYELIDLKNALAGLEPFSSYEELLFKLEIVG